MSQLSFIQPDLTIRRGIDELYPFIDARLRSRRTPDGLLAFPDETDQVQKNLIDDLVLFLNTTALLTADQARELRVARYTGAVPGAEERPERYIYSRAEAAFLLNQYHLLLWRTAYAVLTAALDSCYCDLDGSVEAWGDLVTVTIRPAYPAGRLTETTYTEVHRRIREGLVEAKLLPASGRLVVKGGWPVNR